MATQFTEVTPKDLQVLQGIPTYKRAWAALRGLRDSLGVQVVLVRDLARYWGCPEAEIIAKIS